MIFQHTLESVLNQGKTQTRRIIKPDEYAVRARCNRISAVMNNGRVKWCVGNTYAVQPGRGKPAVARVRITQINSEYITRIKTVDAVAEGFSSRREFLRTWQYIHGDDSLDLRVWVFRFKLADLCRSTPQAEKRLDAAAVHR